MLRIYHHSSCVRILCVHAVAVVSHHERKVEANGWAYPFALSSFICRMCVWVGAFGLHRNHRHRTVHANDRNVGTAHASHPIERSILYRKWVLCNSRPYFIFRCLVLFGDYVLSHSQCSGDLCTVRVIGPSRFAHFAITLYFFCMSWFQFSFFFFSLLLLFA